MKNKIIYLLVFLIQIAWAQKTTKTKLAGFPYAQKALYKKDANGSVRYISTKKTEIIATLGQANISRNDADEGEDWGYDGLFLSFDDGSDVPYMLAIQKLDVGQNPYYIGDKYKLGIGSIFPKQILDEYEGRIYIKDTNGPPISPTEEPSWDAYFTRQYSWYILNPNGEVSDSRLTIDVNKAGQILNIHIGMSQ